MPRDKLDAARRAAVVCGAAAALALPATASAYCRTSVCTNAERKFTGAICTPPRPDDCGIPLAWPAPCVTYSLQEDSSDQVPLEDAEAIFAQAFAVWTQVDCGEGQGPRMRISYAGPVACDVHEYNQGKGNANVIMFRDNVWPYPGSGSTLALTTVTYNLDTGEIYDADMEVNSSDVEFTFHDGKVGFDLLSIATHEAGHFLGLSHSQRSDATMFADYRPGTTTLRDLTDDDGAGICEVYPPGPPLKGCDPAPRHGFSRVCSDEQADGSLDGCATAPSRADGRRGGWLALAAVALAGSRRRRAGARRPGPGAPGPVCREEASS